jgi:hypothetical protein
MTAPHHSTVQKWVWRYGCAELNSPKEQADDWIAIGDLTVSLGKMKVMAVLGVRSDKIMNNLAHDRAIGMDNDKNKTKTRSNLTLSHEDVEVLALAPCERSNWEFVNQTFEHAVEKVGGSFKAIVIDRGSDIKKGAKFFQQSHLGTKIIHDISHLLSNVMEKILKDDPIWIAYLKDLTLTRHRVQVTEFAALMPPTLQRDARYMDISDIVYWSSKIADIRNSGNLDAIPEERFNEYLGWLKKYEEPLAEVEIIVSIAEMIKEITREEWLSAGCYEYISSFLEETGIVKGKVKEFVEMALALILEETNKLGDDTILASTEVLESIFGKYKLINSGSGQGVSGNVLGMCIFAGSKLTEEKVLTNLETCSTQSVKDWVVNKVGETIGRLRKRFFKKTKIDEKNKAMKMA